MYSNTVRDGHSLSDFLKKNKYALPVMCKKPNIFGFMRIYSDSNNEKNPNANLELLHPVSPCYVGVGTDNQSVVNTKIIP